jgi:hypothetical protein
MHYPFEHHSPQLVMERLLLAQRHIEEQGTLACKGHTPGVVNQKLSIVEVITDTTDYPVRQLLPWCAQISQYHGSPCDACSGTLCGKFRVSGGPTQQIGALVTPDCPLVARLQKTAEALLAKLTSRYMQPGRHLLSLVRPPPSSSGSPPLFPTDLGLGNYGIQRCIWCPLCMIQVHPVDAVSHLRSFVHRCLDRATPPQYRQQVREQIRILYLSLGITIGNG